MIHVLFFTHEGKRHLRIVDKKSDGNFMLDHAGDWILASPPGDPGAYVLPPNTDFVETRDFVSMNFDDDQHAEFVAK